MKTNQQMRTLLQQVTYPAKLPMELLELARSGFESIEGCTVLSGRKSFAKHVTVKSLGDKTGFESFVNDVRLNDYVDEHHLGCAIWFVREVFGSWKATQSHEELHAAVFANEMRVEVRFVMRRDDEPKLLIDDLDSYRDGAILEIDSYDNWPFA